jgi:hypothetical protein
MTYVPDEEISGWHWHDTNGTFESCCVVTEGTEDSLYVVVLRSNDGGAYRSIERMANFASATSGVDLTLHRLLDCHTRHSGLPSPSVTDVSRFEGVDVTILSDDGTISVRTVASGTVATDSATSLVGLPYTSDLRTLPIAFQIDAAVGQGRTKNINRCWVRVANTCRFEIGYYDPSEDEADFDPATTNDLTVTTPSTTEVDVNIPSDWTDGGQVWLRQEDPLPLTVVSLCMQVSIGD